MAEVGAELSTETQGEGPFAGLAISGGTAADVTAFTQFYLATRASLRGYLGTMLHNDAACEDCMQEAVLVVWK